MVKGRACVCVFISVQAAEGCEEKLVGLPQGLESENIKRKDNLCST